MKIYKTLAKKETAKYNLEARRNFSEIDSYQQSIERTKYWTKDDFAKVKKENEDILQGIAADMDKGYDSPQIQKYIRLYRRSLTRFYDVTRGMYRNLGSMCAEDQRCVRYYDKYQKGLGYFLRDAIHFYCAQQLV